MRGRLDAEVFRSIVAPPTVYENEAHVRIQPDAFHSHATDASHVSWVDIELSANAFDSFDAEREELALDVTHLARFGELLSSDATLAVNLDTSTGKATVRTDQFQFESSCLVPSSVPKVGYGRAPGDGVRATVSADTLFPVVDLAANISPHFTFGIDDEERLYATASGQDDGLRMDFTAETEITVPANGLEVDYPLDKILDISKVVPSGTDLRLSFGDDSPLQLQYEFADGHGTVAFTVRPRY